MVAATKIARERPSGLGSASRARESGAEGAGGDWSTAPGVTVPIMVSPQNSPQQRAYRMMQMLMASRANDVEVPVGEDRGVVELEDALDAVIQAAAVIDEYTQDGSIPVERGVWAGGMLMVIRDYLQPLPPGTDASGHDKFTDDLREMVEALREARS